MREWRDRERTQSKNASRKLHFCSSELNPKNNQLLQQYCTVHGNRMARIIVTWLYVTGKIHEEKVHVQYMIVLPTCSASSSSRPVASVSSGLTGSMLHSAAWRSCRSRGLRCASSFCNIIADLLNRASCMFSVRVLFRQFSVVWLIILPFLLLSFFLLLFIL